MSSAVSFRVERFERLAATETAALLRVIGSFSAEAQSTIGGVVLKVERSAQTLRLEALADAGRAEAVADGRPWRAAFSAPAALASDAESTFSIETEAGSSHPLPAPTERLLGAPGRAGSHQRPPLADQAGAAAAERNEARQAVEEARGELAEARRAADALDGELRSERERRGELEQQTTAAAKRADAQARAARERLEAEVESARADLESMRGTLEETRTALAGARAEAQAESERRASLEHALDAPGPKDRGAQRLTAELDELRSELERRMAASAELEARVAETRRELAAAIAREDDERAERARLEEELRAVLYNLEGSAEIDDVHLEELDRAWGEARRRGAEVGELQRRVDELRGELLAHVGGSDSAPDYDYDDGPAAVPNEAPLERELIARLRDEVARGAEEAVELERRIADVAGALGAAPRE